MKHSVLLLSVVLIAPIGCTTVQEISYDNNGIQETAQLINPTKTKITTEGTKIVAVYKLGAFTPKKGEYGFRNYNGGKTKLFLAGITHRHNGDDIIEVDGLKWKKVLAKHDHWIPYPNPPTPQLDKNEDRGKHIKEYAKWINDHPHFGYPPLPIQPE